MAAVVAVAVFEDAAVVVAVLGAEYVDQCVYAAAANLLGQADSCIGLYRCWSQTFRAASSRAGDRSRDLAEVVVMS